MKKEIAKSICNRARHLIEEYEPYGIEWEKEVMKLTKKQIIQLYKKALKDKASI